MKRNLLISFLLVLLLYTHGFCEEMQARVVRVIDGDTVIVSIGGLAETIRLAGIDCPENGQSYGEKARKFTYEMIGGKDVTFVPDDLDRYGRTIAKIFIDGKCLNNELVKAGYAWHYKKYSSDKQLADLEQVARSKGIGLWGKNNSTPPWKFRKEKKVNSSGNPYSEPYERNTINGSTSFRGGGASSSTGKVHVRGHWRKTPSGGSAWVKPHTRSKPKK